MHMYCTGCTCIFCWAWTWAWDWVPLSRNCCGQCRWTLPLTASMYCSHNNTLVKIPNPGNGGYTDHLSVYRPRWQPWLQEQTVSGGAAGAGSVRRSCRSRQCHEELQEQSVRRSCRIRQCQEELQDQTVSDLSPDSVVDTEGSTSLQKNWLQPSSCGDEFKGAHTEVCKENNKICLISTGFNYLIQDPQHKVGQQNYLVI